MDDLETIRIYSISCALRLKSVRFFVLVISGRELGEYIYTLAQYLSECGFNWACFWSYNCGFYLRSENKRLSYAKIDLYVLLACSKWAIRKNYVSALSIILLLVGGLRCH